MQKTQEDYIKGLVETRKACDLYSDDLTTYPKDEIEKNLDSPRLAVQMDAPEETQSYIRQFTNYMGITEPQVLKA